MKVCGIYILTFPNGKKYVGQSVDIFRRFRKYMINNGSNFHLTNALKKYGWNNVKKDIIELEVNELDNYEDDYVYILKLNDRHFGYNKKEGGNKARVKSTETLKRLSESHKKYKFTDEHKRKLSESCIGNKNGFYGKHHTEDTKNKMSEIKLNNPMTDEYKKKLVLSRCKKTYKLIDKFGNVFNTNNLKEFARNNSLDGSSLYKVLKGIKKYKEWRVYVQ